MTKPTPRDQLYAFHTAALAGRKPRRSDDNPQCGWYRAQLDASVWTPVHLWMRQVTSPDTGDLLEPEVIMANVGGDDGDPIAVWPYCEAISRAVYNGMQPPRRYMDGGSPT